MAFSPNGTSLIVGTNDGKLLILNLRAPHSPRGIKTIVPTKLGVKITAIAIYKDASPQSRKPVVAQGTHRKVSSPLTPRDTNVNQKSPANNKSNVSSHKYVRSSALSVSSAKSPISPRSSKRGTSRPTPYTNANTNTNTPLKNLPRTFEKSPQVADLTASVSGGSLDVSSKFATVLNLYLSFNSSLKTHNSTAGDTPFASGFVISSTSPLEKHQLVH